MKRETVFAQLTEEIFDTFVVGGGIVGAGVARDAAMRGLRVALVDRHDFAFGTSSRSSRLLHGGLRYLEQGRVRLVREASVEKMLLHKLAPHLAQPLGFVFPAYRGEGRPLWQLGIGVKLYDLLCGGRNLKPSRRLDVPATQHLAPQLKIDQLVGAVLYYDGLTNDARLVLDTLRAATRHGAVVANYTRLVDAARRGDVWHCEIRDELSGRTATVRARSVVNATGPWAEAIPHSAVKLRLSKGIHIVVDRTRLATREAVVITEGKRLLFVLPWGERTIVGTTDTDYDGAPEAVRVQPEDVRYVLDTVARFFPQARLSTADVISSWAGLRPLVANPDGTPSDVSREHQILSPEPGWWDITGGKLTTYRLMAQQAGDHLVRFLGRGQSRSRTADEPLLPDARDAAFSSIVPGACTRAAVEHYVRSEWARNLDDVLVRRSSWHYYHCDTEEQARRVAAWMAPLLNWSPEAVEDQIERYHQLVDQSMPSCC
ncbi:MAG: glycerol-3-phosphate dehydrogenase/oxidase [Opitutae bacterium]|nr:glycerol-3-phosphate dehydrogenase/oxidase [Opitutae bacterium]